MMMWKRLLMLIGFIILLSGCASTDEATSSESNKQPGNTEGINQNEPTEQTPLPSMKPEELAQEIVLLLKEKDMLRLAAYVHPSNGLRLSPYGHIDTQKDIVLSAVELQTALE